MNAVIILVLAYAGACLGSFFYVLIKRLPKDEDVIWKRSCCDHCHRPLKYSDLFPIISYLALLGRCRYCKHTINMRHFIAEIMFACWTLVVISYFGLTWQSFEVLCFTYGLWVIAWMDLETWNIPLSVCLFLMISGLLFGIFSHPFGFLSFETFDFSLFLNRLLGLFVGFCGLSAVLVVTTGILRRTHRLAPDEWAMGWGDPILLGSIGAYLGALPLALVLFLGSLQAVLGYFILQSGLFKLNTQEGIPHNAIPFGPFLALGAIEVAFLMHPIWL